MTNANRAHVTIPGVKGRDEFPAEFDQTTSRGQRWVMTFGALDDFSFTLMLVDTLGSPSNWLIRVVTDFDSDTDGNMIPDDCEGGG